MRIRRSAASSVFPSPVVSPSLFPSPSSSSFSSSSSCFSSSSTISAHSLSSSTSSSSSSSSSFSVVPTHSHIHNPRCQGLDLLVKAVYHVAGSVVGVPYIQKRVIRRRKPAVKFSNLVIRDDRELHNDDQGEVFDANSDHHKKQRRRRRLKPTSAKLPIRRRRRSKA